MVRRGGGDLRAAGRAAGHLLLGLGQVPGGPAELAELARTRRRGRGGAGSSRTGIENAASLLGQPPGVAGHHHQVGLVGDDRLDVGLVGGQLGPRRLRRVVRVRVDRLDLAARRRSRTASRWRSATARRSRWAGPRPSPCRWPPRARPGSPLPCWRPDCCPPWRQCCWPVLLAARGGGHGQRGSRRDGPQAAGRAAHDHPPSGRGGRSAPAATPDGGSDEPPFLRGQVRRHGPGVRARPGRDGASPLRDSAGISPASLGSTPSRATRDTRSLPQAGGRPGSPYAGAQSPRSEGRRELPRSPLLKSPVLLNNGAAPIAEKPVMVPTSTPLNLPALVALMYRADCDQRLSLSATVTFLPGSGAAPGASAPGRPIRSRTRIPNRWLPRRVPGDPARSRREVPGYSPGAGRVRRLRRRDSLGCVPGRARPGGHAAGAAASRPPPSAVTWKISGSRAGCSAGSAWNWPDPCRSGPCRPDPRRPEAWRPGAARPTGSSPGRVRWRPGPPQAGRAV